MMELNNNFICQSCSNGCNLSFRLLAGDEAEIFGYQCRKGLTFAGQYLSRELKKKITIANKDAVQGLQYSFEALSKVAAFWNIRLKAVHPDIDILGSPERINFRTVIESDKGELFKLEKIFDRTLATKTRILKTLEFLHAQGLKPIVPYFKTKQNDYVAHCEDSYWQLAPFVKGRPLNRLKYIFEGWRGNAAAQFLIDLSRASKDIPFFDKSDVFSLPQYIIKLMRTLKAYEPKTFIRIEPVAKLLEADFFPLYDNLPVAFCHGDYHPLNIIWSEKDIEAVIDWEFAGYKSEMYDVANMMGCLGVENPQSLQGDFVAEFVNAFSASGIMDERSWGLLLEFIVAQRFAWLSEWLRKKDAEMIELETTYMELLINNKAVLTETWKAMRVA